MRKTQIYFPENELAALHVQARRTGKSVASMVREAVRAVWLRPAAQGPVGLWTGEVRQTAAEHDSIYDAP